MRAAAVVVILAAITGRASATDAGWATWPTKMQELIDHQNNVIHDLGSFRDSAARAAREEDREPCIAFYDAIISRRKAEVRDLENLVKAFRSLPEDQRDSVLPGAQLGYDSHDERTAAITVAVSRACPAELTWKAPSAETRSQ
jgi:hypothetical protein